MRHGIVYGLLLLLFAPAVNAQQAYLPLNRGDTLQYFRILFPDPTHPVADVHQAMVTTGRPARMDASFKRGGLPADSASVGPFLALSAVAVFDTAIAWTAVDTTRHCYNFDPNREMTLDLTQRLSGESWVDVARVVTTYDTRGNMLSKRAEVNADGLWSTLYRSTYTYDLGNNQRTFLFELGFDGQLTNNGFSTYTYDAQGNMLEDLGQFWSIDSAQWLNNVRKTFVYDVEGRPISSLYERWAGEHWVNVRRRTFSYDEQGRDVTELEEHWGGTTWGNIERQTRTFDAMGNQIAWLSVVWLEGKWANNMRGTNTFDSSGSPLSYLDERWWSDRWRDFSRHVFSYDASHRQTSILVELDDLALTVSWPHKKRHSFTYDDRGRLTLAVNENWKDSSWVRGYHWEGVYGGMAIEVADSAGNSYEFGEAHTVEFRYRTTSTDISSFGMEMPANFALFQNYPNPFNPSTTIRYALPWRSHVTLTVFNMLGQQVATLVDGEVEAGQHEVQFNAAGLASGVYFYRLQAGNFTQSNTMCLVR